MATCDVCNDETTRRCRCKLCGVGGLCLACATDPKAHYCRHALPLRTAYQKKGKLQLPTEKYSNRSA